MYFQHFIQCLKSCATFVKYCIGLCLNGFSKQKIQFIQSQHIISESKSQYNWSGKFNQPFCSRGREHFEIMNLLSRYLNFLICTSSSFLLIQYLKARNTYICTLKSLCCKCSKMQDPSLFIRFFILQKTVFSK